MPEQQHVNISVGGDLTGQVAIGEHIRQQVIHNLESQRPPSDLELEELHREFSAGRDEVAAQAPAEQRDEAVRKLDELEAAVTADEPRVSTMEHVRDWFADHLPGLLGSVTSLVVHPIVGKLVGVAGDAVVREFRRRFNLD